MLMRDLSGESKPRLTDFCKVEYNGEDLQILSISDSNELFSTTHIDVSQFSLLQSFIDNKNKIRKISKNIKSYRF